MTNDQYEQPSSSSAAEGSEMATLLEDSMEYRSPHRGDIVEGTAMSWDREGLLVDIGAKSEGVVPRNEMQSLPDAESKIQPGDKILVFVVQPDTSEGHIGLSLDRARGERGWHVLQERFDSGETFEAPVTGYNKGGLLVNVEGVNAFVPLSQLVGVRPDRNRDDGGSSSLAEAVGKELRLKVIEINRRRNRVILSERAALQEWRMQQKERLIQELHEGDIRRGRVSSVRNFGVFVDLGGADGLAHLSELSWERDKSPTDLFNVGDEVDVFITKIDAENKKIALSLRRANPGQWEAVVSKYHEGQVVTGLVTKLVTFGAFARIEGPVEGLIHVSELVDRRIGHPKEVTQEGDLLPLKIVRIERDRHRLGLSLRRAREEGEGMGFVFTEGGEVLSVPEDVRNEFIAREGPIPEPSAASDDTRDDAARDDMGDDAPAAAAPSATPADGAAPDAAEASSEALVDGAAPDAVEASSEPPTEDAAPDAAEASSDTLTEDAAPDAAEASIGDQPMAEASPDTDTTATETVDAPSFAAPPAASEEPVDEPAAPEPDAEEEQTIAPEEDAQDAPQASADQADAPRAEEPAPASEPAAEEPEEAAPGAGEVTSAEEEQEQTAP